ncbi:MAG: 3-deoxy-manno-octulosonate cytidylyltransferase [Methylacidiphilales bacterium]|nr:3-deoxy-manno-octulosonate cytidylyltransferase [Candidatus Methylacidiphilales bacterium]
MSFTIIIPARYSSTRLEKKLLLTVNGKTLLQYVYEQCQQTTANNIIIATDHEEIEQVVKSFGAVCVMTPSSLQSGTERVAFTCSLLELKDDEIVVNVQGDEPHLPSTVIELVAQNMIKKKQSIQVSSAAAPIFDHTKLNNPNVVKVITDVNNRAIYFSRHPIPYVRNTQCSIQYWQHLGIYCYQVSYLRKFLSYHPSYLEQAEMLEQLRSLWYRDFIEISFYHDELDGGIDTIEDFERFKYSKIKKQ